MIIPFPGARRSERAQELRRTLVAVVDEDLAAPPEFPVAMDSGVVVRFVAASAAASLKSEPDLWVQARAASSPDRRVLCETLAGEVIEQDAEGVIWVDETRLEGGVLLRAGSAAHDADCALAVGASAALLLIDRSGDAYRLTVRVTAPLLWVFEPPRLLSEGPVLLGWTGVARCLWLERR